MFSTFLFNFALLHRAASLVKYGWTENRPLASLISTSFHLKVFAEIYKQKNRATHLNRFFSVLFIIAQYIEIYIQCIYTYYIVYYT